MSLPLIALLFHTHLGCRWSTEHCQIWTSVYIAFMTTLFRFHLDVKGHSHARLFTQASLRYALIMPIFKQEPVILSIEFLTVIVIISIPGSLHQCKQFPLHHCIPSLSPVPQFISSNQGGQGVGGEGVGGDMRLG